MWVGMGRTRGAYNLLCPFEINLICLKLSFGTIEGPSRSALSRAPGRLWGKKGLNSIKPRENDDDWAPRSMKSANFAFYVVWAFKNSFACLQLPIGKPENKAKTCRQQPALLWLPLLRRINQKSIGPDHTDTITRAFTLTDYIQSLLKCYQVKQNGRTYKSARLTSG